MHQSSSSRLPAYQTKASWQDILGRMQTDPSRTFCWPSRPLESHLLSLEQSQQWLPSPLPAVVASPIHQIRPSITCRSHKRRHVVITFAHATYHVCRCYGKDEDSPPMWVPAWSAGRRRGWSDRRQNADFHHQYRIRWALMESRLLLVRLEMVEGVHVLIRTRTKIDGQTERKRPPTSFTLYSFGQNLRLACHEAFSRRFG